ncbi:MAG TPA: dTDP-4-dehydrorhamnose reductase [Candidatus Binatia bacterium]
MRVLITGAAGLVGSHLTRRLRQGAEVLSLKHSDLDITDRAAVERCVAGTQPDLIINCAVLQVDDAERAPQKAAAINIEGPRFLAEAGNRAGAEIVHFSTQYVFAGEPLKRAPYTIRDKPSPVNVYGKTKLIGEEAVHKACGRSYIIRTAWVYGAGKESFLCTVHDDLRMRKRVHAIDDIWSSTTYIEDLIDRVMAIQRTGHYGTYHVVNSELCSYYEFALEAGRLVGLDAHELDSLIAITHERDMRRIAKRPSWTPLRCLLSEELGLPPMREWRAALAAYAEEQTE